MYKESVANAFMYSIAVPLEVWLQWDFYGLGKQSLVGTW